MIGAMISLVATLLAVVAAAKDQQQPPPLLLFMFNLSHKSGGPAAMHAACFHADRSESNTITTAFLGLNFQYATQYPNQSCNEVPRNSPPFVLNSRDIIVVPESWQNRIGVDQSFIDTARSAGARGITYVLSIAGPYQSHALVDLTSNGWIPLAHSHYTREYFGIPWQPLLSPLEPYLYNAETLYSNSQIKSTKENIVVIDDDARVVCSVPGHIGDVQLNVVQLSGFTSTEVIDLYQRAKIVVDLYVNGLERATLEGILFDAYPIVVIADNGMNPIDFNLPSFAKVDAYGFGLAQSIHYIISNYHTKELQNAYQPFKSFVLDLQVQAMAKSFDIFHTSRLMQYQILLAGWNLNSPASLLGALTIFQHYPLASIEIVVLSQTHATNDTRDVGMERFVRRHGPLLNVLTDLGLTSRQGGDVGNSLRIRGSQQLDPNMPSVIHGDYLLFADEPIMFVGGENEEEVERPPSKLLPINGFRLAKFEYVDEQHVINFETAMGDGLKISNTIGSVRQYGGLGLRKMLSEFLPGHYFQDTYA